MINEKNQAWSSRFGFLMATVGSAVGLGNIWRFPYIVGNNGGAIFLIAYVLMISIIGFAMMLAEFSIGRHSSSDVVTAYKMKHKNWGFIGILSCIVAFMVVSYYVVIGGWIIKYAISYLIGGKFVSSGDYEGVFNGFMQTGWQPILYLIIFIIICLIVILFGVQKGIEKVNKILMPLLFVFLIFVMVVSLTMKGSGSGVKFFIVPDFSQITANGSNAVGSVLTILLAALGQAFYSLSIGLGVGATYGGYAGKSMSLTKNSLLICIADSIVAIVAGFAILPAVFASGLQPTEGSALVFKTLPAVFNSIGGVFGNIVACIFFFLVLFAAITSAIALIEVNVSVLTNKFKLNRNRASLIVGTGIAVVAVIISLSQGGYLGKVDLLDIFDKFSNTFLLPIIALLTAVFVGYVWKPKNAIIEITNDGEYVFRTRKIWSFNIKYICPVLISILLVYGIVELFL